MQAAVDALAGPVAGSNASATLQQVCYKPLGDDCATQSILQVRSPGLEALLVSLVLCRLASAVLCWLGRDCAMQSILEVSHSGPQSCFSTPEQCASTWQELLVCWLGT